jgi:hypothetical protein
MGLRSVLYITKKGALDLQPQVIKFTSYLFMVEWVCARFCILQKGCTRLAATSDKVYQLLAHGQWFSQGTPASSTTKTGHQDITEILLKVALKHNQSINQSRQFVHC